MILTIFSFFITFMVGFSISLVSWFDVIIM